MTRRLTWFVTGAVTGAAGSRFVRRKTRQAAARITPRNVARSGAVTLRRKGREVVKMVRFTRPVGTNGELEGHDHPATIADRIAPDEEILVDGRPVDRGRIVVTRMRR